MKQIIEKRIDQDKEVCLGFIGLEKTFDKVPREKLWRILAERGID